MQEDYPRGEGAPAHENGISDSDAIVKAKILVMGVGGAGNNAVNNMIESGIANVKFVAVNTDAQILACSKAPTRIQLGAKGLGAGAEPEIGREAAEECKEQLTSIIEGNDLLFITAGMGGGTGTGAAPVIAKIAKDKKILTVAVVTMPFSFEGRHRRDNALKGIDNLRKCVDTIIIVPNDRILDVISKNASVTEAFRIADNVLKQGIRGIADVITLPALINLDFADVRTILKDKGLAYIGVGVAKGENRIVEAVRLAVNSPLLETTIVGATSILINITGGDDLTLLETRAANELICGMVDYSANIIFGVCIDHNIQEEVEVTVIATGFPIAGEKPVPAAAQTQYRAPVQPAQPMQQPAGSAAYPRQGGAPVYQQPPQGNAPSHQPPVPVAGQPAAGYTNFPPYAPQRPTEPAPSEPSQPTPSEPAAFVAPAEAEPQRPAEPEPHALDEDDVPLFIRHIRNKK